MFVLCESLFWYEWIWISMSLPMCLCDVLLCIGRDYVHGHMYVWYFIGMSTKMHYVFYKMRKMILANKIFVLWDFVLGVTSWSCVGTTSWDYAGVTSWSCVGTTSWSCVGTTSWSCVGTTSWDYAGTTSWRP